MGARKPVDAKATKLVRYPEAIARGAEITGDPGFTIQLACRGGGEAIIFRYWHGLELREAYEPLRGSSAADQAEQIRHMLDVLRDRLLPPEGKATNPKDGAATTRLDLSLFPDTARIYGALAFTEGDLKYGGYNFREAGAKASVYLAALGRHIAKWTDGEDVDPVTCVPHLANALACIAVLIDGEVSGNLNDDRPIPVGIPNLLDDAEAVVRHLQNEFPRRAARVTRKGTK